MADNKRLLGVYWLISHLRWGWIVIAVILLFLYSDLGLPDPIESLLIPGVGILLNIIALIFLALKFYPNWLNTTMLLLDVGLGLGLIWLTGGHNSPMLPVLIFPVISLAISMSPEMGMLLGALPVALVYGISLVLNNDANAGVAPFTKTISDLTVLFAAALVAGILSKKQLRDRAIAEKLELHELRREAKQAKTLFTMANTLSSTLNYRKVLNIMVNLALRALAETSGREEDKSAMGMILLFEGEEELKLVAGRNLPRYDDNRIVNPKDGLLAQVIYEAEPVIDNNALSDPVLSQFSGLQNARSVIIAPLRAGFDMYGAVLFASPKQNVYSEEHMELLTTFSNQAIISLQNAQLYADLEQEQKKLLEKEAQARHELARNLHDGPTQAVAAISMRLNFIKNLLDRKGDIPKAIDELNRVEEIALRTTKEIRNMLFTLRPIVLETQGLAAALEQYADRIQELETFRIQLDIDGYGSGLSTREEGVIFAIIEEAVGNAKKYAKAEIVAIRLTTQGDKIIAEVRDNGRGFDVQSVKSNYDQRGSLGLLNMEERARMVNGRCQINSELGKGTLVRVEVPRK